MLRKPITGMAPCARASQWQIFDRQWGAVLERERLPYIHYVDLVGRRKIYRKYSTPEADHIGAELTSIALSTIPLTVSAVLRPDDYRSIYKVEATRRLNRNSPLGILFRATASFLPSYNRAIGAAVERARMPRGPQKSAEWGASVRANIFEVVEAVEAKTGSYAFAVAGPEQALMTSRELQAALRDHKMSDILELAFPLMFTTPATKADLIKRWPEVVASFSGRKNTADVLMQKAALITGYVLNHYDIPLDALSSVSDDGSKPIIDPDADNKLRQELDESVERELKLEAAASWYRLVDELAFRHIKQERELFSDYLIDNLAEMLALQGAGPDEIVDRLHQRSTEYASVRNWIGEPGQEGQSLFWKIGKHALIPLSAEKIFF